MLFARPVAASKLINSTRPMAGAPQYFLQGSAANLGGVPVAVVTHLPPGAQQDPAQLSDADFVFGCAHPSETTKNLRVAFARDFAEQAPLFEIQVAHWDAQGEPVAMREAQLFNHARSASHYLYETQWYAKENAEMPSFEAVIRLSGDDIQGSDHEKKALKAAATASVLAPILQASRSPCQLKPLRDRVWSDAGVTPGLRPSSQRIRQFVGVDTQEGARFSLALNQPAPAWTDATARLKAFDDVEGRVSFTVDTEKRVSRLGFQSLSSRTANQALAESNSVRIALFDQLGLPSSAVQTVSRPSPQSTDFRQVEQIRWPGAVLDHVHEVAGGQKRVRWKLLLGELGT